jgi:hypothetical protein
MFVREMNSGTTVSTGQTVAWTQSVGDLIIVTAFAHSPTTYSLEDAFGEVWTPLPRVLNTNADCGEGDSVQWFYTLATAAGSNTITSTDNDSDEDGLLVASYRGVTGKVNAMVSTVATTATSTATTGTLVTTADTLLVAMLADDNGGGVFSFDNSVTTRGVDNFAYSVIGDNAPGATAGTFAVTGTLPNPADDCWVGYAVAFELE